MRCFVCCFEVYIFFISGSFTQARLSARAAGTSDDIACAGLHLLLIGDALLDERRTHVCIDVGASSIDDDDDNDDDERRIDEFLSRNDVDNEVELGGLPGGRREVGAVDNNLNDVHGINNGPNLHPNAQNEPPGEHDQFLIPQRRWPF